MEKKFCKLAHIGADVIMPAILYALNRKMQAGIQVDLAEAYTLLNDTQAVYLTIASGQPDRYYTQLEPTIRALLVKYEIQWALDRDALAKYCQSYMKRKGFTHVEDDVYSYPEVVAYNNYDRVFIRALIGTPEYNPLEAAIQDEMDVAAEMDVIDKKLDRIEEGCCSECGTKLDPDIDGPFMCLACDEDDGE
ncbi:hypothetical protein MPK66_gp278 [Erwinia phage pEa_SNUABM_2]|uniref:Uncharacterized protein n=1 Tax=Erwinia phage pEa_SNUABM_2 TaxID=2869547 RepID=A0AAE7XQ33_9CAUD|nr:hypothetical protein MPK66_gp278 [Erwinia phage pEa_SNUABM_2]QZE59522.1 hypothetical protein pEaSNUABM2_00278 [Erwinia phage pEa_SNUABM_2]QZE59859.1 hypothetical protein pEaSNUABM39_00279 [Erwinia phage pEa_SNUABM_39]